MENEIKRSNEPIEVKPEEISSYEDFKKLVSEMKVNIKYIMPKTFFYEWLEVEYEKEYGSEGMTYCWSMKPSYNVSGRVGYVFPLEANGNLVKQFKTEAGAKRNLIKHCEFLFRNKY